VIPIRKVTPNVLPVLLTKFSQYSDFELRNQEGVNPLKALFDKFSA
jgi:hypothetical protein